MSTKTHTTEETGPKRFVLVKPYDFRGTRHTEFTAREPKVRDLRLFLRNAEQDPILAIEAVMADLCQVDQPVIADLSIKDFGRMKAWFEGMLADLNAPENADA